MDPTKWQYLYNWINLYYGNEIEERFPYWHDSAKGRFICDLIIKFDSRLAFEATIAFICTLSPRDGEIECDQINLEITLCDIPQLSDQCCSALATELLITFWCDKSAESRLWDRHLIRSVRKYY